MPLAEYDLHRVAGLREHLAAKVRTRIDKLAHATETSLYDFSPELSRLRDRLLDLEIGADVLIYRFEIPAGMQPARDGRHVFTLTDDDRLVPADYERAVPSW